MKFSDLDDPPPVELPGDLTIHTSTDGKVSFLQLTEDSEMTVLESGRMYVTPSTKLRDSAYCPGSRVVIWRLGDRDAYRTA